ncbi:tripartite tricarboxylate transporter substrate binding protein [Pusillimonas sp. SM2304]|uniref:Bug family tripartite tricarboxylate transporter substrate binding protein n=1 Tax=Pusillimonas sp. SM2304 TaxID=3073241 RepID=UPI0028745CF2|nr:tripartite tricarboxylate transporter substrate binding protein [Pusillimonas sp. SM2304]MDS1142527.1 tripartite tricarboxylate transporter substrate binding protein [Pusillimonas sp. SM2304]
MYKLTQFLLAGLCLAGFSAHAATDYPARAVTVVVPYAPGGTTDIMARITAQALMESTGKSFVVENKGGASGTIAMSIVATAKPDGYTLLSNEMTQTIVPSLFSSLAFDPVNDIKGVSIYAEAPYVLAINAKLPVTTLSEFVDYAKARPGDINFASGGVGSGPHMAGELLKSVAGIDMTHIPYKGSGPALNDLLSGQVDVLITAAPTAAPYVNSGRIKVLAVAHDKRVSSLPDVPTSVEAGLPEFRVANWFGLAVPKDTPEQVSTVLFEEIKKALSKQAFRDKLVAAGAEPVTMSPEETGQFIQSEARKWSALVKKANIVNQ